MSKSKKFSDSKLRAILSSNSRANGECVEWTGGRNNQGYGQVSLGGRSHQGLAHRISYSLSVGRIPKSMSICHRCDNPICINPNHLFLGTQVDNLRDMQSKGRQVRGTHHGRSKLNEQAVRLIRKMWRPYVFPARLIAEKFGVSITTIQDTISGKNWSHIK